jgi:S1-C subfamily serine protease
MLIAVAFQYGCRPSEDLQDSKSRKMLKTVARTGWIGILWMGARDPKTHEALPSALRIERVVVGGPADRAGLRIGDIIVGLNGRPFADAVDLQYEVTKMHIGDKLSLQVERDGQKLSFEMSLVSWQEILRFSLQTPGDGLSL